MLVIHQYHNSTKIFTWRKAKNPIEIQIQMGDKLILVACSLINSYKPSDSSLTLVLSPSFENEHKMNNFSTLHQTTSVQ